MNCSEGCSDGLALCYSFRMVNNERYFECYRQLQAKLLDRYGLIAQSRFLNLEKLSTRIHVLEAGAGEPIVFLHGGGGIAAEHIPVAAHLAKKFRVIMPDRPGHGLSDEFDYRNRDLRTANVAFVEALLDELGVQSAALIGNSYGGFMALNFALAHPERVSKLIHLSFSPGLLDRRLPSMMRLMVTPILGRLLGATLGRPNVKNTRMFFSKLMVAHIDRMPDELVELETLHSRRHGRGIGRLFRAGFTVRGFRPHYVMRDELPKVRVPTTFLWGERDAFMTCEAAQVAARLVPGARFEVIRDAGHLPSTDQPEATAALLDRELGSC
jgi:pimeloyl-ACP methyl ester carboxylesterase